MSHVNKKYLGVAVLALLSLVGCTKVKYPKDYDQKLYPNVDTLFPNGEVVENDKEDYYKTVLSSDNVYRYTVDDILKRISKVAYFTANNDNGTNGSDVVLSNNDVDYAYKSVYEASDENIAALSLSTAPKTSEYTNQRVRSERSMLSSIAGKSYSKDNLFYEKKLVTSLKEAYTLEDPRANATKKFDDSKINLNGVLVTPDLEFADVLADGTKEGGDQYAYYMENSLYDDMRINYLTSEYIFKKSYSSIGNTNARKVEIIALTDRTDEPGDCKALIDAYIEDYIKGGKKDEGFRTLSRLWKGITSSIAEGIEAGRYPADASKGVVLTAEEEQWLADKGFISYEDNDPTKPVESTKNLIGKVLSDKRKLDKGANNLNLVDTTLESSYTGSYSYDYETGVRKAVDDIATRNLVTKGIYLKSDGLSSLPNKLKDRIFSVNVSTDKDTIADMKANPGKKSDVTVYQADGYRYVTTPSTLNDSDDDLVYYDSSSKTYYITRLLDAISSSALSEGSDHADTDSIYNTHAKKEQIAREVAYVMSTTGSYKTESAIYWLRRTNIKYSDSDFLEYMKSNYKDLFKKESAYDSEPKIVIAE